jgi:hypothetical protein
MLLKHFLWGHMKGMVNQQKLPAGEELLQQIMESADCIRGNDEMIRRATNSLRKAQNYAYTTVRVIVNSDQGNRT